MKLVTSVSFALLLLAFHASAAGKKGGRNGGKKGFMSMITVEEETTTLCAPEIPLTCPAGEEGSTVTPITDCFADIQQSGVYTLDDDLVCDAADVVGTAARAILIRANDVTLDCQNRTVTFDPCLPDRTDKFTFGIELRGDFNNVVVKNCNVECASLGISANRAGSIVIKKSSVDNSNIGIRAIGQAATSPMTILDTTVTNSLTEGMLMSEGQITVVDSEVSGSGTDGILLPNEGSSTTFFSSVISTGNAQAGFRVRTLDDEAPMTNTNIVLQNFEACGNEVADVLLPEDRDNVSLEKSGFRCVTAREFSDVSSPSDDEIVAGGEIQGFCECTDCPAI